MRATRRAGLAAGVVMALALTTAGPVTAAPATTPPQDRAGAGPVDHALVSETLATAWEAAEALDRIGLTADDLALPERDDDLYAEVADGLAAWLEDQGTAVAEVPVGAREQRSAPARASDEADALTRDRLAYSWHIAEVNAARDRRAGPMESEVVYMYLSHYVDTPRGTYPGLGAHSNHDQYYAAWISDDDRRVYDQFLKTNSTLAGGNALVESAKALVGLKGLPSWETLTNLRDLRAAAQGWLDVRGTSSDLLDAVDAWRIYLGTTADAPEQVVQSLVDGRVPGDGLEDEHRDKALGILKAGLAAVVLGGGGVAVVGAAALAAAHMAYLSVDSLAHQANYAGMIASNRGRVAERMWRFLMGG